MPRVAGARRMATATRSAPDVFPEKEFYLEEFRGRSVLLAVAPAAAAARGDLGPLTDAIVELVRHDVRVLLWWPDVGRGAEQRMRAALARGRRAARQSVPPVVRLESGSLTGPDAEPVRSTLWSELRRERLCVVVVPAAGDAYPDGPASLATALRVPKLVLLDPGGGLLGSG